MEADPDALSVKRIHQHMIRLITPRPIAWVSTVSAEGVFNLAPFSYFNGVGANPPSVVFCPANKRDGTRKDTLVNIEETGEFVVNVVSAHHAGQMHQSSALYESHVSEFEACGLTPVVSSRVTPPRVAEAAAHLECRRLQTLQLGKGPAGANLVVGRVVMIHIDEQILADDGLADPAKLDTLGRMGGCSYTRTRDRFDLAPAQIETQG